MADSTTNRDKNNVEQEEPFSPRPRVKPFNESGLEGGIAFIYDWRKRNATLPTSEVVRKAADGILIEGQQCCQPRQAQNMADLLLSVQDADEETILKCCINLYTRDSFLYRSVNTALRNNDTRKIETFAPFCYFLTEAIWSQALSMYRFKSTVYRRVALNEDLIRHFKEAEGTYRCWYGFSSSSKEPDVADMFGDTLLIIDTSCVGGLDLSTFSVMAAEDEVILSPGTTFRIDKVEHNDTKTYIYICLVPEVRMVLLGRTGTGKSSFANTILGRKYFKARKAARSITTKCQARDRIIDGKRLVVVDTPGFFDTELSPEMIIPEICGSYQVAAPGPDVFLVVMTFDRFTPQEEAAAKWISEVFDERALDYCIIVFTGLDNLKRDETTVEEFLQDAPVFLQNLIQKCGGRYFAVDNTASDDEKEKIVKDLLERISAMVQKNGGQFYNNKTFVRIATVLEEYPGWFDPLKSDRTVNLLPETEKIVSSELSATTIFKDK